MGCVATEGGGKKVIITPTYAQISIVKLILKLLRRVSVVIHRLQGIYKLCQIML